jgi:hypothetical protein
VAVDRLKTARAAGTAEHGDTDEQLVTALARKAHRLDPEALSVNLLLGTVGMRLIVPEVEHQLITTLLSDVRRAIRGDCTGCRAGDSWRRPRNTWTRWPFTTRGLSCE